MIKPKIVFIEPNLKNVQGHVFSVISLLSKQKSRKIISKHFSPISFCGHKDADINVVKGIKEFKKICTKGCFETQSETDCFLYIKNYIKKYGMKKGDLIVFTTAYINELKAVFKLVSEYNECPKFLLHLHQFFPPFGNPDIVSQTKIQAKYKKAFKNILVNLASYRDKVNICVTPVKEFKRLIQSVSTDKLKINELIVPFLKPAKRFKKPETVSFLGDGRKEKGLLVALKSFVDLSAKYPEEKFYIQVYKPRGFSVKELKDTRLLCEILESRENVYIREQGLSEIEYEKVIDNSKLIFIPYDINNYRIRFSGIACEAIMRDIPIITTHDSSVELLVKKYKNKTPYIFVEWNRNVDIISGDICSKFDTFLKKCNNHKNFLNNPAIKDYSINNYIRQIISLFYGQSAGNSSNSVKK
ncbi:MAG: glycosyltransferase [Candidatus Zambryskibacteria bacterium]|nr:glycosyltransferase [Candidatus Zambryskibacteria bacterium]